MLSWLRNVKNALKRQDNDCQLDDYLPKPDEENDPVDDPIKSADFSTAVRWNKVKLKQFIAQRAIPTAPAFVDDAGFAMDDASVGGKSGAYTFGGTVIPDSLFSWYVSQTFIGWQACAILAQHWLVAKACNMSGADAVSGGWKINRDDGEELTPEQTQELERLDRKYKIRQNLKEASFFRNVFGIRLVWFKFSCFTDEDYAKKFDARKILPNTYEGMAQIDPYWASPLITGNALTMGDISFYTPEWWQVSGRKIHRSHFVILYGQEVADVLKPAYLYGGIPLTQRIYERVYAAERTANEAPQLALTKRMTVRYTDLAQAVANQDDFESAISFGSQYQDNYGVQVAGIDERVERHETSLADLDATIMTQYQLVAAIAEVPATKLLGTSPKGFGASGDYEIKSYHEKLREMQSADLDPILKRHYQALVLSEMTDKATIKAVWEPLDKPSAAELATINKTKADTDVALAGLGALDGAAVLNRLINDEHSGYTGLSLEDLPEPEPTMPMGGLNGPQNPAFGNAPQMGGQPQENQENPDKGNNPFQPGNR